jgi:hypothetical protein
LLPVTLLCALSWRRFQKRFMKKSAPRAVLSDLIRDQLQNLHADLQGDLIISVLAFRTIKQ